jgi:hypothetical protein
MSILPKYVLSSYAYFSSENSPLRIEKPQQKPKKRNVKINFTDNDCFTFQEAMTISLTLKGYSYYEIGERMDIKQDSAKYYFNHAKAKCLKGVSKKQFLEYIRTLPCYEEIIAL